MTQPMIQINLTVDKAGAIILRDMVRSLPEGFLRRFKSSSPQIVFTEEIVEATSQNGIELAELQQNVAEEILCYLAGGQSVSDQDALIDAIQKFESAKRA